MYFLKYFMFYLQMEKVKQSTGKVARLVAEKEALEAVAMQLAEERDEAMGEVGATSSEMFCRHAM